MAKLNSAGGSDELEGLISDLGKVGINAKVTGVKNGVSDVYALSCTGAGGGNCGGSCGGGSGIRPDISL